jgi:hypothetical protein
LAPSLGGASIIERGLNAKASRGWPRVMRRQLGSCKALDCGGDVAAQSTHRRTSSRHTM